MISTNTKNVKVQDSNKDEHDESIGIWWDKTKHKWCAEINYKKKFLGRYLTIKGAKNAREKAEASFFNI